MTGLEPQRSDSAGVAQGERRASARISCVEQGMFADFEGEIGCLIADFGRDGFSLIARDLHVPGAIVDLTVHLRDGRRFVGRGAVTSALRLDEASVRYGIQVLKMQHETLSDEMGRIFTECLTNLGGSSGRCD